MISNQIFTSSPKPDYSSSAKSDSSSATMYQSGNRDVGIDMPGTDNDSEASLQSYPELSYEESFTRYEQSLPSFDENFSETEREKLRCSERNEGKLEISASTHAGNSQKQEDKAKDEERSEITLPSYTEMCGDEESLDRSLRDQDVDEDTENDDLIPGSNVESIHFALPGCSGDFMVGNQLAQDARLAGASSPKNYRYIGKRRPNYEEFEATSSPREEHRVPPADSTAHDVHLLVNRLHVACDEMRKRHFVDKINVKTSKTMEKENRYVSVGRRWLDESDGKTATETGLMFSRYTDIRNTCPDRIPRLSSSCIELSSPDCRNRKRKMFESENEAVTRSRSETNICRRQPRKPNKKRKVSTF